jgi:predicted Zn-dependent peptidase
MELPPHFGGWHREVVEDDVATARTFLTFRIPPFGAEGWYAASLLGAVLGMGEGARLPRALVREQMVAADAGAYTFDLPKGADLLICDVTARPGVPLSIAMDALVAEIERIRRDGVTPAERERALALAESSWVIGLQSAGARADKLSQYATYFGDPKRVNEELARYAAVTVEDLQRAATELLGEDNRVSLSYVPRTAAQEAA